MVFLENIIRREWHKPYAFLTSGYSSNSIAALCFCLSVHLSADLKSKYRERISNSLRVSPTISISVWDIILVLLFSFLHFLIGLLYGIPTVFDA